jgi:hypothetical protein
MAVELGWTTQDGDVGLCRVVEHHIAKLDRFDRDRIGRLVVRILHRMHIITEHTCTAAYRRNGESTSRSMHSSVCSHGTGARWDGQRCGTTSGSITLRRFSSVKKSAAAPLAIISVCMYGPAWPIANVPMIIMKKIMMTSPPVHARPVYGLSSCVVCTDLTCSDPYLHDAKLRAHRVPHKPYALALHSPQAQRIDCEHGAHRRAEEKAASHADLRPGLARSLEPDAIPATL